MTRTTGRAPQVGDGGAGADAEHLLRHAPIGVATLDSGGAVVACNLEAARLLEVDRDAAPGRAFDDLVPEAERDRIRRLIAGAGPEPGASIVLELRGPERKRYVELSAS